MSFEVPLSWLTKAHKNHRAWGKITLCAGTSGVDALVTAMNAKEDSNFRLFAYVGDVNAEAEKVQAQAQEVQREIDRYQAAADAQEAERQAKLQVRCDVRLRHAIRVHIMTWCAHSLLTTLRRAC